LPRNKCCSRTDWVTAKVIASNQARRIVNRLDALDYDYQVVQENGELRIFVRRHALEDVLDWIDDLSSQQSTSPVGREPHRAGSFLLFAIPIGVFAGAILAQVLRIPSPASYAIASYFGLAGAALGCAAASRFAKQ
jgi:hypothetical protein